MTNFIHVDTVFTGFRAQDKSKIFKEISNRVEQEAHFPAPLILDKLLETEARSPSAMGNGVAIPHAQIQGISHRFVCIARLESSCDFDALDHRPVDLIGVLVSPDSDGPLHLQGLSRLSRLLGNKDLCDKIRVAQDADDVKSLLAYPDGWLMAA